MARKYLVAIDLTKQELQNARIQNLASAPGTPVTGQIYYDTSTSPGILYYWNGTTWVSSAGPSYAVPALTLGTANAAGSATTGIRSDASIALFDATAPSTQAIGDAAVVGVATVAARRDHKHAMPAFGAVTAEIAFGGTSANGAAATLAHSDHTHGTPAHLTANHSAVSISGLAVPTADVAWGSFKITGLADPTGAQDAATKAYVDATAAGIDWKASVRAATTAAITTLAGGAPNTLDGVTLAANDRILVKDQSTGSQNGIYFVQTLGTGVNGTWARALDADTSAEVTSGIATFVEEGTVNADTGWTLTTNNPITLATTALVFTQFTSLGQITAGAGLTKTGSTVDVIAGATPGSAGPGGGLKVNTDDVVIDTAIVVRKYAQTFGDAAATSFAISHGLATADVTVQVYQVSDGAQVEPDITRTSASVVTLAFTTAPASNQYRVVIHG